MSSEWVEQPANGDNHGVPGKTLAAQREAMGWTVEQVADQLKLAVRQVVALEAGDYAALPGPAVVRGFVRAYAKIVKLDAAPLVAQIPLDTPSPSDATGTTIRGHKTQASFSEVRFPTHGKRAALPVMPIVAAVVLAGAVAAAWHFGLVAKLMNRGETAATPASATAVLQPNNAAPAAPVASAPATPTTLLNPSVPLISVPPPSTATAGSPSAGVAPVVAPAVTPEAAPAAVTAPAAAAAPAPAANALVIAVREDSWIEVRRAHGAPLIKRVVKAGSTETFDITEPVTLVVGKPTGVSATLRGAALDLPAQPGAAAKVNLK
ncbi:helix-turn-helix domain-containing protein [Massilia sp. R2A-15]|uniref:helix-turn-helix domain-containing protein n=1 Tax=Massilia sp. R2A-15 TaxID=3064278 RepID=UPI002732DA1A|nr:helix-turn-helix domain-containing protein [Massilia sp. R2A-15]WLI87600.1 helix-turn-helix domain-containing protein [Massilia sp. R2A-15]